jgi:hypothetical protein
VIRVYKSAVVKRAKGMVCQRGNPKASGMPPKRPESGAGVLPWAKAQSSARAWRR